MKICRICKKDLLLPSFSKDNKAKDKHCGLCKECKRKRNNKYYNTHKEQIKIQRKKYASEHEEEIKKYSKKWRKNNRVQITNIRNKHYSKFPWRKTLHCIRGRCKDKSNPNYGGKGIKCFLNNDSIKALWDRDKAGLMNKPSIHRKKSERHYTYDNCEFKEWEIHSTYKNKK